MHFRFLCALPLLLMAKAETIHFTNSPGHLVRSKNFTTYKLEVPGSNSITIVEANDRPQSDAKLQADVEAEDSIKDTLFSQSKSSIKKTVFAPTLLDKFLQEYKVKVQSAISLDSEIDEETREPQTVRQDRYRDYEKFDDDEYPRSKIRNPFNDKEGWVSLQAIPWSKSQVSKWKPKGDVKPLETVSSINVYSKPHPYKADAPSKWESSEEVETPYHLQNRPRPHEYDEREHFANSNSHPSAAYMTVPWNTNKPSRWPSHANYNPDIESSNNNDRWYDYGFRPDFEDPRKPSNDEILVNDYNANAVRVPSRRKHQQNLPTKLQPQHSYRSPYSKHPSSYPSNGNGEWVLLSTTKGYHNNRVHRAMNFSELKPSNTTIKTHRAIKLTVLPAKTGGANKTTMTTLYGGLLEVDSSLQPVEASAAAEVNKKKIKSKLKGINKTKFIQAVPINSKTTDESAVLAAVGAGMVPATVAMLMPVVLGRKKRDILSQESISGMSS